MKTLLFVFLSLLLCSPAQLAFATKSDAALAKLHVKTGRAFFEDGHYEDAADEFEAAFALEKVSAILFNAAQSRRLAKQTDKAVRLYRDFMQLFPADPQYEQAKAQLHKLQHDEPPVAVPPATPPAPDDTNSDTQVEPTIEVKSRTVSEHDDEEPAPAARPKTTQDETPLYKKAWFWGAVAGGAVVVIGTITLAVVLTRPTPAWTDQPNIGPGTASALTVHW